MRIKRANNVIGANGQPRGRGSKELTDEQVEELFSELDESGLIEPDREKRARRRLLGKKTDPLSGDDPSGSRTGEAITRTAVTVILGVLLLVVGMQIAYGVNRRLSTANLSESADADTVAHALETGVEWGNGFTQFPEQFTVDEADERSGVIEVSVTDTDSKNELALLSNSQIQAAALATNALLNNKISRVVYNVYVLQKEDGSFAHDSLFGFIHATGTRRAMLTFIWTKDTTSGAGFIDWELKIIGMDDETAEKIESQVNSMSSLVSGNAVSQGTMDDDAAGLTRDRSLHGAEILRGGAAEKTVDE